MAGQCERLLEGMVRTVARLGYRGASVAKVIEAAGVSRATFYEHFENRDACFLAAYREVALRMRMQVREAAAGRSPAERPRAVLNVLLGGAADEPAAARLVLIEALAAAPAIRFEHEQLIADTETAIEGFLSEPGQDPRLQVPPAALLGGVISVISMHLFNDEGVSLPSRLEDLLAWICSYALSPGERRLDEMGWRAMARGLRRPSPKAQPAVLLPRGRTAPSARRLGEARRERIVLATAQVARERGYAAMTVAHICAAARVSRGMFYSHFDSKEAAFLAAQTVALQDGIALAAKQFFVGGDWPERVWGGLSGMLGYFADHPDLTHMEFIETYAAGRAAIQRAHDSRMAYGLFLEEGYRLSPSGPPPRSFSEAIAGAIFGLMRRQVLEDRTTEMRGLLPATTFVALAPFIGPEEAMAFVESKRAQQARSAASAGC